ncbi:endonuclease VII domain-containing protein [Streptomyces sp. NPDC014991]|uniref:endonuclease VII domain-containing protein n=1 Tax=Streptomyces sp. NPDC014991 TaxID=3364935 RepID=UPI0037033718
MREARARSAPCVLRAGRQPARRPPTALPGVRGGVRRRALPAPPGGRAARRTGAERDELTAPQGGARRVCPPAPPAHVDHCHETGRVRGVLCFSCNAALGQFKDQPEVTRRAAAYVEGIAWKPTLVAPGVYQLPS